MPSAQDWHFSFLAQGFSYHTTMPPLYDSAPTAIPIETRQALLIAKATAMQDTSPEFKLVDP